MEEIRWESSVPGSHQLIPAQLDQLQPTLQRTRKQSNPSSLVSRVKHWKKHGECKQRCQKESQASRTFMRKYWDRRMTHDTHRGRVETISRMGACRRTRTLAIIRSSSTHHNKQFVTTQKYSARTTKRRKSTMHKTSPNLVPLRRINSDLTFLRISQRIEITLLRNVLPHPTTWSDLSFLMVTFASASCHSQTRCQMIKMTTRINC